MMAFRLAMSTLTLAFFAAAATFAQPKPLENLIDEQIEDRLKADNIVPAPQADDAVVIRRLTLDLAGRIPTALEVEAYVRSTDNAKRAQLVDRLMASPAYSRNQAIFFETMLNDRPGQSKAGNFRDYLISAIKENRPWDQMFRDILLPDDADAAKKGASEFLRSKLTDMDKLTNDVSVAFFGVNISCAQCHDHPNVKDWTQDHYYGMKSFLARTYEAGGFIGERPFGQIKYKPNKGAEKKAQLMFLTGSSLATETSREPTSEEQMDEKAMLSKLKSAKKAPPVPEYSARAQLVNIALQQPNESNFFARSIVNRLWHRFLGWGLVNPLDQMHSENQVSHPALLNQLAADMVANKYNLNRLVRGLVMSNVYSRSSRYENGVFPSPRSFAVARLRALTPQQLATSLKIATTDARNFEGKPEDIEKKLEQAEASARGFAALIAQPTDNFQIGVSEALLFSNGGRIQTEFLTDGSGTLLGRLKTEKDPEAAIRLLVRSVLGRPASSDEISTMKTFIDRRKDRMPEAYKQLLWALLTSPEFRFNH